MAKLLSTALNILHLELDAVNHQPGWVPLPVEEFQSKARALAEGEAWVIDGNYHGMGVQDIVWERADTVVWIDLPKRTVMRQLVTRTVRRGVRREVLWNGNRERLGSMFKWQPEENVVRWAWTRFDEQRERYEAAMHDARWSRIDFLRLRTRDEVDGFLRRLN